MSRQCNRAACCETAAATLGYDYRERAAWLVDLIAEPHPATYDLCFRHADGLTVPMGWALHDRRRIVSTPFDAARGLLTFARRLPQRHGNLEADR